MGGILRRFSDALSLISKVFDTYLFLSLFVSVTNPAMPSRLISLALKIKKLIVEKKSFKFNFRKGQQNRFKGTDRYVM